VQPRLRSRSLVHDIEVREWSELADQFRIALADRKAATRHEGFAWYPNDSFGALSILDNLLKGRERWLRSLIGSEPVVDIGCGDGDLSFFLQSLGPKVYAVDYVPTNYNLMQGVKALKSALHSSVRTSSADLDALGELPVRECGLALFLGVLYHLKNPFSVLERLAGSARYCLLSTAIAAPSKDQHDGFADLPAAFLAGKDGLRGDQTNYWFFTEAALRNLVDRSGWEVCAWSVVDNPESTTPGAARDQRAICLLRSGKRPAAERSQLFAGWHKLENDAWRWTERRFSVWLAAPARIELRFTVPASIGWPIVLSAGAVRQTFDAPGEYRIAIAAGPGVVEFEIDRPLPPDRNDGRERGIVVRDVRLS